MQVEAAMLGEAESTREAVTQVSHYEEEDGEEVLAEAISDINADCSLGVRIPVMEIGTSLVGEYKEAMENDETLGEWKSWGRERKNGFKWDDERVVEDVVRGNREILVVPKGMRLDWCMNS